MRSFVLACVMIAAIAAVALTVPRFGIPHLAEGFNPSSVAVRAWEEVEQSFTLNAGGLHSITFRISASQGVERVAAELSRRERGGQRPLAVALLPIDGDGRTTFTFAPIDDSRGVAFLLRLRPHDAAIDGGITLDTTEGHSYGGGQLSLDGKPLPLDLIIDVDARNAQPWRAFAATVQRRTGIAGLEWLLALGYLGAASAVIASLASRGSSA